MQKENILLTLLVGEKEEEAACSSCSTVEQLKELAHEFAAEIDQWDEESPLDAVEEKYTPQFQNLAQTLSEQFDTMNEQEEMMTLNALIDEKLQWELLQYDDSVLSILLGTTLPEGVADERFNLLVRRYPEWALALAESMEEEECQCGCHSHDDHDHCCQGHCHHHE